MLRFVAFAVLLVLAYLLLRATLAGFLSGFRGQVRGRAPARAGREELVKDPVCDTYVPRRTALARTAGAETYYFCSPACAAKFQAPS